MIKSKCWFVLALVVITSVGKMAAAGGGGEGQWVYQLNPGIAHNSDSSDSDSDYNGPESGVDTSFSSTSTLPTPPSFKRDWSKYKSEEVRALFNDIHNEKNTRFIPVTDEGNVDGDPTEACVEFVRKNGTRGGRELVLCFGFVVHGHVMDPYTWVGYADNGREAINLGSQRAFGELYGFKMRLRDYDARKNRTNGWIWFYYPEDVPGSSFIGRGGPPPPAPGAAEAAIPSFSKFLASLKI